MADPRLMSYLEECILQCTLCNDEFKEPKTLDCLHTFCLPCLEEHISQTQTEDKFPCPTCKYDQDLPEDGSAALDSSFIHQSVTKISRVMRSEDTMCTSCAENSAETACYNCGEFLCPDCEEKHGTLRATKDHIVCPLSDLMNGENLIKFQRERFDNCDKHGELRKLFCRKCEVPLCNVCVYDDKHQQHDVTSILSKVEDEVKVVERKMETLSKDQEGHQSNLDVLQEKLTCVQENQQQTVEKIEAYAKQMHDLVEQYKTAMIGHVKAQAANNMSDIQGKIASHKGQMHRKGQLCKASAILEELPLGSILPASEELLKKLERCKRPYVMTRQQLDRANPDQDFIGRDEEMTQDTIDNCLKSLFGHVTPLPDSDERAMVIIDNDMVDRMDKQAISTFNSVITHHATSPRNNDTFKAVAKAINDKWRDRHTGDWKCCVGAPGLGGKAGFTKKTKTCNIRVDIEGFEIHLFQMEPSTQSSRK